MKKALITGIAGQDGSYLAELLLSKGYEVHGVVRRIAIEDSEHKLKNISHLLDRIHLHVASLDNVLSLIKVVRTIEPAECYHLAASSFVSYSFEDEISILNNNVNNTHYLLAALREFAPDCRIYFAGSSELFGSVVAAPQDETTPFNPRSIYGISKMASYHLLKNYREQYGLFSCAGILYNHESPRRGYEFVTRKIVSSAVKIKLGLQKTVALGNLDAHRDWGYAPDYVQAMWLMLQADTPDDYVVATGETHSVREFVELVFTSLGLDYQDHVQVDPQFFRPTEKVRLCGNPHKIESVLGWKRTACLSEIIAEMVTAELALHHQG
ncbi:GDPmannose 4,6-dehydratase [Trichlorobacter thiogenes]|uniref:GDP-mannose 4,6-dehydratase n=1 Tax=Trichlorobacter thiogenes TaxID=115783 RepID=A0A1T4MS72_9BACT|nr:GDP-mannose 4,6-dehydratase [Trichlorobacter thiogenes]SJZ69940.1 GDPmannose 4,6-dehydratase [Trichlorobacter thiogenes]